MRFTFSFPLLSLALCPLGADASPTRLRGLEQRAVDVNAWCGPSTELQDMDSAKEAFDLAKVDEHIYGFIKNRHQDRSDNWLEDYQKFVLNDPLKDPRGARNCANAGLVCEPGDKDWDCEKFFEIAHARPKCRPDQLERECKDQQEKFQPNGWMMSAPYVFLSVQGMHDKMKIVKDRLLSVTLSQGFSINSIAKDLGASMEDDRADMTAFYDGLGIAFGVLGAVGGFIPGIGPLVSTGAGVFGSLVENFRDDEPFQTEVPVAEVEMALAKRFTNAGNAIDKALRTAVGQAVQDSDYAGLSGRATTWDRGVANFFSHPFWLLDNNNELIYQILDKAEGMMKMKLVESLIIAMGLEVVGRNGDSDSSKNKEECEGNNPGRRWLEVEGRFWCFGLSYRNGWREASWEAGIYEKIVANGIERLSVFYRSAIECDRVGGAGSGTRPMLDDIVEDIKLPRCFFSIPVRRAWHIAPYGRTITAYEPFFQWIDAE